MMMMTMAIDVSLMGRADAAQDGGKQNGIEDESVHLCCC